MQKNGVTVIIIKSVALCSPEEPNQGQRDGADLPKVTEFPNTGEKPRSSDVHGGFPPAPIAAMARSHRADWRRGQCLHRGRGVTGSHGQHGDGESGSRFLLLSPKALGTPKLGTRER